MWNSWLIVVIEGNFLFAWLLQSPMGLPVPLGRLTSSSGWSQNSLDNIYPFLPSLDTARWELSRLPLITKQRDSTQLAGS